MLKNSLSTLNDKKLISLTKKGDSPAFQEICKRYENVFYKVCQKYVKALSIRGVNVDDVFDEKNYIILHCIHTYNPGKKAKLSTWIGNYARYLCLNAINKKKYVLNSSNIEVVKKIEKNQFNNEGQGSSFNIEDYNYIINIISQLKDKRIEEIFKYRYFGDKKMIWSKIATRMGISTQTVINLHNKGLLILRKKIKSPIISDVV